jgi:hypothetical protein
MAFVHTNIRCVKHGAIAHIRLIDGKIWIPYDDMEEGVATELLEAGVPKAHIVLGFLSDSTKLIASGNLSKTN